MSMSRTAVPGAGVNPFELRFSLTEFAKWLLRRAMRRLRGRNARFHLDSPPYSRHQIVVDREMSQKIRIQVRDAIDIEVLRQIFQSEDYRLRRLGRSEEILRWPETLKQMGKAPLILDLGANTGLASLYFAREFSTATIVALEPDPDNVAAARRNLKGYAAVTVVEGGIAATDGRGEILNPGSSNWSYRTELSQTGAVAMYSIERLIATYGQSNSAPFIAKIDIEGFESNLFSQNTGWIDLFPIIVIELHDWMLPRSASSGNFLREISRRNRDFVYIGENVFSISNEAW